MHALSPRSSKPARVAPAAGLLLALLAMPADAAELPAESSIAAVTVFPDRARVTREIEVTLPAGASTLVVTGLPASLIGHSVRVEGSGSVPIEIGAVETKQRFSEAAVLEQERRLKEELEALADRRRAVEDRIAALKLQQAMIGALGEAFPKAKDKDGNTTLPSPDTWAKAWTTLGEGTAAVLADIQKAEIEMRAIDRSVERKNRELGQVATGRRASVEARIGVETTAPGTAKLHLHYQIAGASWRPLYDARLRSEDEAVSLAQIGEVRQRTGEDWSDVALTLSTARPATGAQMPELATWFVDIGPHARADLFRDERKAKRELLGALEESRVAEMEADKAPAPVAALKKDAIVATTEFAAEYQIAGKVDVPSDSAPHKFPISEREIDARLAVRSVPKHAPRAYLYAEVTYEGEDPLLPGPVAVFRDGAFIGNSGLDLLRPGEDLELSFGVDDRVRITYELVDGERSSEGLIRKDRRIERRYLTTVKNLHRRAIEIAVLDQLPVAADERIEVELLDDTTPATETDVDDRRGVLAWIYTYEPGEEREIDFGYAVQYPEAVNVPGF